MRFTDSGGIRTRRRGSHFPEARRERFHVHVCSASISTETRQAGRCRRISTDCNSDGRDVPAATGDVIADHVFGQTNLNDGDPMIFSLNGMSLTQGVAIDASSTPHHLYISDTGNSRVLGYYNAATLANGQPLNLRATPPDIIIGQVNNSSIGCNSAGSPSAASLCLPVGLTLDSSGNLYVADAGNNRVLAFAAPFKQAQTAGQAASAVLGQGPQGNEFLTNTPGTSQSALNGPSDVAVGLLG